MTVVAMEMAARSVSLRWPANDCVMTAREYKERREKMEGPAIFHILFDSTHVRLIIETSSCCCSWWWSEVGGKRGCWWLCSSISVLQE
ncbi:hypothetical protein HanOQP8_Chr05g0204141 [Helianthus annuus]|nr:hypothetical protein HanOQP8_Chr05g0204141 [Helianthus annuus]